MEDCNCNNQLEKDYSKPTFSVSIDNIPSIMVTIYGDMFQYRTLNGLYLSSSNTNIPSLTTLDLYSNVKSISAKYPPITVFPVEKYDIVENYILQFKLPTNLLIGNYDIIYFNDAGYFKASKTKRFTYFTITTSFSLNVTPTPTPTPTATPEVAPVTFIPEPSIDADNDGYSDLMELSFGTDPNDSNEFPVSIFNVYNNI